MPHHVADVILAHHEVNHDPSGARLLEELEERLDGLDAAAARDSGNRRTLVALPGTRGHPRDERLVPLAALLADLLREAGPAGRRPHRREEGLEPALLRPVR